MRGGSRRACARLLVAHDVDSRRAGARLLVAHDVDGVAEVAVHLGHAVAVARCLAHPAPGRTAHVRTCLTCALAHTMSCLLRTACLLCMTEPGCLSSTKAALTSSYFACAPVHAFVLLRTSGTLFSRSSHTEHHVFLGSPGTAPSACPLFSRQNTKDFGAQGNVRLPSVVATARASSLAPTCRLRQTLPVRKMKGRHTLHAELHAQGPYHHLPIG